MAKTFVSTMLIVQVLLAGLACGPAPPTPALPSTAGPAAQVAGKPAWQQEWENTVAEAKKEGTINIRTTSGPGQTAALREGLMRAYGINIEFTTAASGNEANQKMFMERRAGLYQADFVMAGPATFFNALKPAGVLDPVKPQLALPEVLDPKAWYGGNGIPWLDKEGMYVPSQSLFPFPHIVVNSDLVKPEDLKENRDLLNSRWKGKIVLRDPTTSGGGRTWVGMAYTILGPDFVRQFATQEFAVTRDARQQVEWVARGKYPVLVGVSQQEVAEFLKLGAPLRQVLASDLLNASAGMTPVLVNRTAHPNAAKVFINWLLTREGQTVNTRAFLQQSTRLDAPTDHLPPETVRQAGAVYLNSDTEDMAFKRETGAGEAVKLLSSALGMK